MNKSVKVLSLIAVVALTFSCKENPNEVETKTAQDEAVATVEAVTYKVDGAASNIAWVGSKPTEDHTGNISITSGMVKVNGETIESGDFVIDMKSIEVTDIKDPEGAASLKAHLEGTGEKGATDFFNTTVYPTAKFAVTGVNTVDGKTMLEGNLTLKDITKNVSFPVTASYQGDKMMLNSEQFTIDRTEWDIKYGSQKFTDKVLDSAISDDIKLTISVVAVK